MSSESGREAGDAPNPSRRRQVYTEDFRRTVVERALEVGVRAAAKEFGVNSANVVYWRDTLMPRDKAEVRTYTTYSAETRRATLALCAKVGNKAAAEQTGIPLPTIVRWKQGGGASPRQGRYTEEFRRHALAVHAELGLNKAATELGTPKATLSSWIRRETPFAPRKRTRTYSDEQRAHAVQRSSEVGLVSAASELDISEDTLQKWVAAASDSKRTNKVYPAELKLRAVALAKDIGAKAAASELSVHLHTLRTWLREESPPRKRGSASSYDTGLEWMETELPHLASWRGLAVDWLANNRGGLGTRLAAANKFFRAYVASHRKAWQPEVYLSRQTHLPDFYETCCPRSAYGRTVANYIHEFLAWVLLERFSERDDFGRPVVASGFHNPVPFRTHSGAPRLEQSVYSPLPFGYIEELQRMLAQGPHFRDWAWAQTALYSDKRNAAADWFPVSEDEIDRSDPDCVVRVRSRRRQSGGPILEMWSPVRWVALLIKLILPLRTFQVRMLDSGEADTWRYEQSSLGQGWQWVENPSPLREGTLRTPMSQGVLRRSGDYTADNSSAVLYANTNKTADARKSGAEKGHTIPWVLGCPIHSDPFFWLAKLRDWQQKYNRIARRTGWGELDGRHINPKSDVQLSGFPDTCFLFRLRESRQPSERHLPIADGGLDVPWHALLSSFEQRLAARGEAHADGSRIRLVVEGTDHLTFFPLHSLRVSILTALALDGRVPFSILQKVAGHSRFIMTLYYVRVSEVQAREELAAGVERLHREKQSTIAAFLKTAQFDKILEKTICNSTTALAMVIPINPDSRNPAGWMPMHNGLCLVGGNTSPFDGLSSIGGCHNGGPNVGSDSKPRYTSVPGGARNCTRCRWFATEPFYVTALVADFNNTAYHQNELSNRCVELSRRLDAMKHKQIDAEDAGEPFFELDAMKLLERQLESEMHRLGELCEKLAACSRLIERCFVAMDTSNAGENSGRSKQILLAGGTAADVQCALEDIDSELLQLSIVCEDIEVFPELEPGKAILRYSQLMDAARIREGMGPLFLTMTEEQQLAALNETMRALSRASNPADPRKGKRTVIAILDAHQSLSDKLGLDVERLTVDPRNSARPLAIAV